MTARRASAPRFFASSALFRSWLQKNSGTASELVVGFYKLGSGRPSMSWPESVDEALSHGWIDGVRRRLDDSAYQIRFTPRRRGSIWSAINIAKVKALIAAGRMTPAGLAAYQARAAHKSVIYAYEQKGVASLSAAETRTFRRNRAAWDWFQTLAPSLRHKMIYRIVSAKRPATRVQRLAKLIAACESGTLLER
jgi:uncharacterized protein YdeI (YjbR/CyaY-like superfamily)